ncbi:hypothetical protein ACWDSJ_28400 [Nocardia sp. NPDC003482]
MTAPPPIDDETREIILAEYKTLRDEIMKKMDHRTTYRLATLTLSMATMGVGIQLRNALLLLLVPMVTIILGNLTIFQTMQISRMSGYIRDDIEKRLNAQYANPLGWHLSNEDRPKRLRESLIVSYIPNAAIPLIPSVVAIGLSWTLTGSAWARAAITVIDLALIAYFLFIYGRNRYSL